MRKILVQKKQYNFLDYRNTKDTTGSGIVEKNEMSKSAQLARFYVIYNKMSALDQKCMEAGMIDILAARIGGVWIVGLLIGFVIGHFVW